MKKQLKQSLISAAITVVIVILFFLATKGIPLWGAPKMEAIERVEVTDLRLSDEPRVYTDPEKIELARKLMNFLNFKLNGEPQGEPVVTIIYYKTDGSQAAVSANETTVWWHGKARALKDQEMFIKLTEGVFFYDLVAGQR